MRRLLSSYSFGFLFGLVVCLIFVGHPFVEAVAEFRKAAEEHHEAARQFNEASRRIESFFLPSKP